jgi:hypothetical protein
MAGTLIIARKTQVERLRQALQRYCQKELGDLSAIVDILLDEEFPDMFIVPVVISSEFKKMSETQRQISVWKFLRNDPDLTHEDFSGISRIVTSTS